MASPKRPGAGAGSDEGGGVEVLPPPEHLSEIAAEWWRDVAGKYDFGSHQYKLLQLACEALDRSEQARIELAKHDSLTFPDFRKKPKIRPEVNAKRDAEISFARLLRELNLDAVPPPGRPPGLS